MMPVSAVWAGPEANRHFNAPPLMMAETRGSTPFRLDLHVGDVGHTLIVGPTEAGKSVLWSLLALQFRRFIGAQVILFDRGRSARAAASPWAEKASSSASRARCPCSRWPASTSRARSPSPCSG